MSENMSIYNAVRSVPNEAIKPISAGRLKGFSDINPMWRIKKLTEMFGPCGVGWWYEITDKRIVDDNITQQRAVFLDILLFYVDPETGVASHGIPGTGGSSLVAQEKNGPYLSDECFKMALTDAISVASKALGLAAEIYYAKDRSKYTAPGEAADYTPAPPPATAKVANVVIGGNADLPMVCTDCGKQIKDDEHDWSVKFYGKPLCRDCQRKNPRLKK